MEIGVLPEQEKIEREDDDSFLERIWNKITNREVLGASYEIGAGLTFDAITSPLGLAPPLYAALNFGEGYVSNVIAQKIRGQKWNEIDWNEAMSSGALGVIPLSQLRAGKYLRKPAAQTVEKVVGKAGTLQRNIISGGIIGGGDVTIRSGLEGELPDPAELATGVVGGGALAGTLTPVLKRTSKYVNEIVAQRKANKAESELLSKQLEIQEKGFGNATEEDSAELTRLLWNIDKARGLHPEYADYENFLVQNKDITFHLTNKIDGTDPFWAPLTRLQKSVNPADQAKYTEIENFLKGEFNRKGMRKPGYFKKEQANEKLKDLAQKAFAAGKKVSGYRRVAGFIHLNDRKMPSGQVQLGLKSIADKHNRTILDVYEYLNAQEYENKFMHILIKELNDVNRNLRVNKLDELTKIGEYMGKAGFKTSSPVYQRYKRLRKLAERNRYEYGHKESLWMMFVNELTGGDRVSNTFIQSKSNWTYTDFYGVEHEVRGNRSLRDREDLPIFTLVRLQGASENLEDDFLRFVMPFQGSRTIPDDFMEMADILYRKDMAEVKIELGSAESSEEYYSELSRHSNAITQALHVMFRKADDVDMPYWLLEDNILLKIPPKEIWAGLDDVTRKEMKSLKNFIQNIKLIKSAYTDTLDDLLENI